MIIHINGAFGVGKTTVANILNEKIQNSMIYDPEEIGMMLRNLIPDNVREAEEDTDDFQDFELWRKLTVTVAKELKSKYRWHLIVPMTIRKKEYYDYIINGFKSIDNEVYDFCLTASLETIHKRLENRETNDWPFHQTKKCIDAFENYEFGECIDTENISSDHVADIIMNKIKSGVA